MTTPSPDHVALMRLIVMDAPFCIAMLDRELRYLATSRAWIKEFGAGNASVEGLRHYDLYPDLPESWKDAHRRGLAGETVMAEEDSFVRPDGRRTWLRWTVHPFRAADGAVAGIVMSSEDITPRKEAEEALRESEQRYRKLVEVSPDAIFIHQERRVVFVNLACLRLFGAQAPEQLIGRPVFDLLDPDHHAIARERMERTDSGESPPLRARSRTRTLAGETRDVEVTAIDTVFRGRPAIQAVVRDVTDEQRAAAAARESAERLAAIVSSAQDAILSVDETLRVVQANPAAEALFGYDSGELLGLPLSRLVPARFDDHDSEIRRFSGTHVSRRTMGRGLTFGRHRDGHELPLEASIAQTEVAGKRLFTVIHRDMRPRLDAEQALRAGEERFRQLAEAIREVFWLTDVAKDRVFYVSPAYEAIFGRTVAELYERPRAWLDAIHADDRPRVSEAAHRQADGRYDVEYRVVHTDGSVRWLHDRAFPVRDASGQIVRIAGVAEDITERRSLAEQLRQTQKMESIGRLAGGVAHDFNNLLTVIVGASELLREQTGLAEEARDLVGAVLDAARRGAALTRQLLAFTRQEVIELRVTELGAVIADAEKLLRRLIGEDVVLTTRLDSAGTPVRIDPGQWTQVLFNLAVNARDAMPRGGRLTIATRVLDLREPSAEHPAVPVGRWVALRVTDDGVGMSPEVRSHVFEPFFTTKPRGKGTGLGLAVVYGVVQQAGGHIEVASEEGKGTTVTILLPAVAVAPPAAEAPPRVPGRGTEVVLVVEDEASVRRVVVRILSSRGYQVLSASDADAARQLLAEHRGPLHLLLTDVVLPGADGPTLAAQLRAQFPALKVLFASGYVDDSIKTRHLPEDAAFLQKPYTPAVLLERVRAVLDG